MPPESSMHPTELGAQLRATWERQARDGFLLTDPNAMQIPTRETVDEKSGVAFRFRWMPHREIRGNVAELEARGILNPKRDMGKLFSDPRDPFGRHCFLCRDNIAECHPMEILLPLTLAGEDYFAGANFAWIEPGHFTVMSAAHRDQAYTRHLLEAMLDLHVRTTGQFRVLFNGSGAGATIPWHLHMQITDVPMPIETLRAGAEEHYPTAVRRFRLAEDGLNRADQTIDQWLNSDQSHRSINLLVASPNGDTEIFFFPRDRRLATAEGKGLVGGFEVAGDFVLSAPHEEETYRNASVAVAVEILSQISPPEWGTVAAA
jgi:hypothetical protein